ncbi:MAG: AMP-binding protein [Caldimonas sp.]
MSEATGGTPATRLLATVAAVVREASATASPGVTLDSSLDSDLGLDSLARVELVLRLEREFAVALPEHALATSETPRDLLRFLIAGSAVGERPDDESVESLAQGDGVRPPMHVRSLTEALAYHVERQPDRLSVHLYEDGAEYPISYRLLWDGAMRFAAGLAEQGLRPGERVALMLATGRDYLFTFYGTMLAGGVPVPLYPPARLAAIEDHMTRHVGILANAEASLLVTLPQAKALGYLLRARVASLRSVLMPADIDRPGAAFEPVHGRHGDLAFLQYTSGSTGDPKGVILTHANLLANVKASGIALRQRDDDVFVSWLPLYHDMGLIGGCFATMFFGFPTVLMSPLAFLARPSEWMRAIHRHRGTISGGPNFAFELCLRRIADDEMSGLDLSSWRYAFNGAEPIGAGTMTAFTDRFSRWGLPRHALAPVYGLAECTVGLAASPPGEPFLVDAIDREVFARSGEAVPAAPDAAAPLRVVACGQVFVGHDVRVVDAAGLELADRHEGRLQFRGPSATPGYFRNAAATRKLIDGGWLNTGDRAYLSDGTLFVTGRDKDIIIRAGRNISPYELEQAIGDLAAIRRGCVAVFALPDPSAGTERVAVLAELRDREGTDHEELKRSINELAVRIVGAPVDEIVLALPGTVPKTSSGKIRRAAARELHERGPASMSRQPVWWQVARLSMAAAMPQLRRAASSLSGALFALRAWLVVAALAPIALVAAPLVPGRRFRALARTLAGLAFRWAGLPIIASGLEQMPKDGAFVLVANHTSYLDAIALIAVLDDRGFVFVGKRELGENAAMRRLAAAFGAVFVERFDVTQSIEHADALVDIVARGAPLVVFPEGTLERRAGLMPFRSGAFVAAARAGVPVVPVVLRGARSVLRDGTWLARRGAIRVTAFAPIAPRGSDWADALVLRDAVRAVILRHCGEPDLSASDPGRGAG